ncbi:MAG: ABC transporter substrate-binding protein [Alphaproteobacteria bacterium]
MARFPVSAAVLAIAVLAPSIGAAADLRLPVLAPVTGFLALEGTSQRNGAVLALEEAGRSAGLAWEVSDTATAPETAVNAFERAAGQSGVVAAVAPMLGTQMLALVPLADRAGVPLITISGTAKITEMGSPNVFRFFPGDAVVKRAHARFAVEEKKIRKPAVIYQTTAYGQGGRAVLAAELARLGAAPVFEDGIDVAVKDMLPVLAKAREAGADGILLHLHAGSTALVLRQARAMGLTVPIIAGSALHQPQTAALLEPMELAGACAETGSSPISGGSPAIEDFAKRYRERFGVEPDAFALAQYDGVQMAIAAVKGGARTAEAMRMALATASHRGLAMTYRSDGKGNMAHDAVIVCYDGKSRTPRIVKRYENVDGTP